MAKSTKIDEEILAINKKLEEMEERLDIMHNSMNELNSAIDMIVRFSMTAKAFMELSISHGLLDPQELNSLASRYEESYKANFNIPESVSMINKSKGSFG